MFKDFLKIWTGRFAQTIVGLATLSLLLRVTSQENYGLYALILSIGGVVGAFAQLGLTSGTSKLVNDAQVLAPEQIPTILRRGVALQCLVLIPITGLGIVITWWTYPEHLAYRWLTLVGLATFVASIALSELYSRTARTFEKFGDISRLQFLLGVCRLVGTVVPYILTHSIDLSILVFGVSQLVVAAVFLGRFMRGLARAHPGDARGPTSAAAVTFGRLLSTSLPFFVIASSNVLFAQAGELFLGRSDLAALATFDVAAKLVNALRSPAIAFSFVISSRFGREVVRKNQAGVSNNISLNLQISLLAVPAAAAIFFTADWSTYLLAGGTYTDSADMVRWLSVYFAAAFVSDAFSLSLDYAGLARWRATTCVAVAILNIVLCIGLVPSLGGKGAAIAITVATLAQSAVFVGLAAKEFSVDLGPVFRPYFLPLCSLLVVAGAGAYLGGTAHALVRPVGLALCAIMTWNALRTLSLMRDAGPKSPTA